MNPRGLVKAVGILMALAFAGSVFAVVLGLHKHFPILFVSPNPTDFQEYFRVKASLVHEKDEPVEIDVVIGCRTELRQILGEGVSGRMVRVPYTYGVRTKGGQAVIMQTPTICGEDPTKAVPDDYLPMLFYAPDADNLEFMIAYLSEMAYEQPVSKLQFKKATITRATEEEYDEWKRSAAPNVVPDKNVESRFAHYFGGGIFPAGDPKNKKPVSCRSVVRVPIAEEFREEIRALWPLERPRFWVPKMNGKRFSQISYQSGEVARKASYFGKDLPGDISHHLEGKGIHRKSGQGSIPVGSRKYAFGELLRVPYSRSSGLPWHKLGEPLLSIDVRLDLADGADRGFAYCYRDLAHVEMHYRDNITREWRFVVDGRSVASVARAGTIFSPTSIVEGDEFVFVDSTFSLNPELARQR